MDSVFRKLIIVEADTSGLAKLQGDVGRAQAALNTLGQVTEKATGVTSRIIPSMDKFGNVTNKVMNTISTESGKSFNVMTQGAQKAANGMGDFERAMRRAAIVAPVWLLLRGAMMAVFNLIKDQGKFLVDLEDAMARIQIVGKGTKEELKGLSASLVALSYAYGVSATEALTAAKIFSQQGKTVQETLQLTTVSIIAAKVLGDSLENTVNNLTAAVEGFNIPVNQATTIVDKWINVEKQFAVTSMDLANATKVAGASANQLGVTISEFLGDVTAVIEVTRKTGNEAGRALSFIYARLFTTAKTTLETIAKIPYYLDEQGKATFVIGEKTRKLSDILGELASKWSTLDEQEKLNIATKLGSMRQMVVLNALMQNYNASLDARVAALTSAGQAEKAQIILMETASYKAKQLGSAFNNLTYAIADTSAWKGMLDVMSQIVLGYTSLINLEKGYRAVLAETNRGRLAGIETTKNELTTLKELLTFRDKLLTQPKSPENTKRLEVVDAALKNTLSAQPTVKLALEKGGVEELDKEITKIVDRLELQKIYMTVSLEYDSKLVGLQNQKERLSHFFYSSTDLPEWDKPKQRIADIDAQMLELNKKQTEEVKKQYQMYLAQDAMKKGMLVTDEEAEQTSVALTEEQKEQLDLEYQLAINAMLYKDEKEKQISAHIKLIENTKFIYDANKKLLEVEKLKTDLKIAEAESAQQISKVEKEKLDIETQLNIQRNLGNLTTLQLIELEREFVQTSEGAYKGKEKSIKLYELELSYIEEITKATGKYANEFKDTFKSSLKDALQSGDVDTALEALKTKLQDMYFESISTNITNTIGKSGIFTNIGGMFAGLEDPVAMAHYDGIVKGVPYIVQAHVDGMQRAMALSTPGGFTGGGGSIGSGYQMVQGANGVMQAVPSGVGGFTPSPGMVNTGYQNMGGQGFTSAYSPTFVNGKASGQQSAGGMFPSWFPFNQKLNSGSQKSGSAYGAGSAAGIMMGIGGAYSAYQSAGGGVAGTMAGVGGLMMMIPGMQVLGAAMMIGSMLFGGKKQTSTQSSWQPQKVENLPLNVITGGAPLPETYPLPSSAYFAGKQGRMKGNANITITIGNVNGDADEVANKIASKVADIYNRESSRGLNTIFPA